jgi:hypothetical protein
MSRIEELDGVFTANACRQLQGVCHAAAAQWWINIETGEPLKRNIGELLCLVHSEISEAMEGARKDRMDDHLPHRKQIEVELADALIRIFDIGGGLGLDLGGALVEKLAYNAQRADHKVENRLKADGKKF